MSDDEQFKYGLSDGDDHEGELILWETTDWTPFTHVAVVLDHAAFDRYIERVRAEQRETDAQIGHDAAAQWVDEWQPNSHKNSHIEDCVAAAIREASDD